VITLLTGDNSFETAQAIRQLRDEFDGTVEMIDGSELELRQLPDLLMGATLFADKRLVIIKQLADNVAVWNNFADWLPRIAGDIHVVLVEPKPDKRTKTYKDLKAAATVREFVAWGDRDHAKAERWVTGQGVKLTPAQARLLVQRVGIDQWLLHQALEKLASYPAISDAVIREVVDAAPSANVFALLQTALKGDRTKVHEMIMTLQTTSEPYQLLSMLGSQVFQLAALTVTDKPSDAVAKDIGGHPYALKQLAGAGRGLSRADVRRIVAAFTEADHDSKTTGEDPWLLIERGLLKVGRA